MQKTLTFTLNDSQVKEVFEFLKGIGVSKPNSNEYIQWCFKGSDWTASMYTSGKFVLQTSNIGLQNDLEKILVCEKDFVAHIGSDEVGKGDYFGPLVVCSCYIDSVALEKIAGYGIMDSKKLCDEKIKTIAKALVKDLDYEVKIVHPVEYAKLTEKFKNVSIVLAKLHVEVIQKLFSRIDSEVSYVVVDQFSKSKSRLNDEFNLKIPLKQYHHAESDVAVAAASVIARYFFLLEFEKMNERYGLNFPLGATHVIKFGRNFVKKYGVKELENVAKISFRTTKQIIAS